VGFKTWRECGLIREMALGGVLRRGTSVVLRRGAGGV